MAKTEETRSLLATLPGRYYVDPDVFEAEQTRIFARDWFCVARASDFATAGSFQTFDVGGENLIIVGGADRQIRAFFNVCRHRGSRICNEAEGRVSRTFQCPYHVWSYGLDGSLVGAPNMAMMPDLEVAERGLLSVHAREWLGYVWVCLAHDAPEFESSVMQQVTERFGDPKTIDRYGLDKLEVGRRIEYEVRGNWKLVVENFMECYHCANLHPELVAVLPEFRRGFPTQHKVGYGAAFGQDIKGFTYDGREGFKPLDGLAVEQDRHYYGMTVVPQLVINLVPDHAIVHRIFPVAVDQTVVRCDWLFAPEVVHGDYDLGPSIELFHRVNTQDFAAVERVQPSMGSRAYRDGGVYVPAEHHIAAFNQWVRDRLDEPE
ncbi:MAG: aromatic ring-hydroxylating dioxygenase subunit alpha [Chloroflexi bacterium]|nr:MAG: aromatic ring-hydroxylating dioxygenase subunit alpha [Chloroflexota bacterium]